MTIVNPSDTRVNQADWGPYRYLPEKYRVEVPRYGRYKNEALFDELKRAMAKDLDSKCQNCGVLVKEDLQHCQFNIDHDKPLCDRGTNDKENLRLLCTCCHDVKTALERQRGRRKNGARRKGDNKCTKHGKERCPHKTEYAGARINCPQPDFAQFKRRK